MSARIEDYALIGDCETAALVSIDGSIDWLCWPRFDSDACFAALLGTPEHGRWTIAPSKGATRTGRRYWDDTLILETRFETEEGVALLIDFMPLRSKNSDLVRIVVGETGTVTMQGELVVRFGYGQAVPWVSRMDDGGLLAISGPDAVALHTPVELRGEGLRTVYDFTVSAGDRVPFVLTHGPSHLPPPRAVDPEDALVETEEFWMDWIKSCDTRGPWSAHVRRSLITLKALTYAPTGGIVAAPTTSLPEMLGGSRNWDYRYCWLRDATLTLLALMNAGEYGEAQAWRDWLIRAAAGAPDQIQILYGIGGERRIAEWEADWLPGYEGSVPVRVGNAAYDQLQIDVYGEVMDALHQARRGGMPRSETAWALQKALLRHLERIWREPDEGIWEVRGPRRHFTFSKIMAWVAFDRGIKGIEDFDLPGPLDRWIAIREEIHADVCTHGFDPEMNSFVQSYGTKELDASLLLIPTLGFLPISDPRVTGTIAAVERKLVVDGLVLRYDTAASDDGLPPGEGAFLACSFWLADAYVLEGRIQEAQALFERLIALQNDVGLLAEEYDTRAERQVGNFPQAFSHITLVNTAHNLGRARKPAEQRATDEDLLPVGH